MRKVLNIAHRGARSLAPENTIAAARKALAVGADKWETDAAVTSDEQLILFHDDSLTRTTDARRRFPKREPWTFTRFTLAEIRSLDAGSWFDENDPFGEIAAGHVMASEQVSYRGEKVPLLSEALLFTKEHNWQMNLELKRLPPPMEDFPIVERVLALMREVGIGGDQVVISSFVHRWLREVQARDPKIPVQALVGYWRDRPIDWGNLEFDTYNARSTLVTPEKIRELAAKGIRVNLFTVNEEADYRMFIAAGVNGIFTDYPQRLAALLQELDHE